MLEEIGKKDERSSMLDERVGIKLGVREEGMNIARVEGKLLGMMMAMKYLLATLYTESTLWLECPSRSTSNWIRRVVMWLCSCHCHQPHCSPGIRV
jgi:hypothetical protein